MSIDYKELKLQITRVYGSQAAFAKAMGVSVTAINQRLNNVIQWKTPEIVKACRLLGIDQRDAWKYFFTEKV